MEQSRFGYLTIVHPMANGEHTSIEMEIEGEGWDDLVTKALVLVRSQPKVIAATLRQWGPAVANSAHPSGRILFTKVFQTNEFN